MNFTHSVYIIVSNDNVIHNHTRKVSFFYIFFMLSMITFCCEKERDPQRVELHIIYKLHLLGLKEREFLLSEVEKDLPF